MKVFVLSSAVPFRQHGLNGVSAVNVILHQLLAGLREEKHDLTLQVLFNEDERKLTSAETQELDALRSLEIATCEPIFVRRENVGPPSWKATLLPSISDFYPAEQCSSLVKQRVDSAGADSVLTIWSPEAVAAIHTLDIPKIAYQGDIDFGPWQARFDNPLLFPSGGWLNRIYEQIRLRQFRHVHLKLMNEIDVIANVTASNAEFYKNMGHSGSVYVPNTWTDTGFDNLATRTARSPYRIIGHAGYLNRTGSMFGLQYLLAELLPALQEVLNGLDFQVAIIGSGTIPEMFKPYINHPRIVLKGFVDDFDRELKDSDVFLFLNNAGPHIAAYTRHMVAWSMGLCLVAHANSKKAIPEIEHLQNALIASNPTELARLVRRALVDRELNMQIRLGGRRTFEQHFRPERVASILANQIERVHKN